LAVSAPVQPPVQAKRFAQKAARSITELQGHVNNVADVAVFLEVLGYTESLVRQHGFESVHKLAKYIGEFIDIFDAEESLDGGAGPQPPATQTGFGRAGDSPGLVFPALGLLGVVSIVGGLPWLSALVPLAAVAPLAGGALMGLALSEGCLHAFGRLLSFYLGQDNLGEAKRVLWRCYLFSFATVALSAFVVLFATLALGAPYPLVAMLLGSFLAVAVHRISYLMTYLTRPIAKTAMSYAIALAAAASAYWLVGRSVPEVPYPVLAGLGAAFFVLTIPSLYDNLSFFRTNTALTAPKEVIRFFAPASRVDGTLGSRWGVQVWETLPNLLFGTFSLSVLFLDRVVSWVSNPSPNGSQAMLFNRLYDAGADTALILLLPAVAVSYIAMTTTLKQVKDAMTQLSASEMAKINVLLRERYRRVLAATLATSLAGLLALYVSAGPVVSYLGGTGESLWIFRVAAVANVFLSVFAANSLFLSALRRVKILAVTSILCTVIVGAGGYLLAQNGFENIVIAYLISSITAAVISSLYIRRIVARSGSILLSKYL
jgi:hypothetical protein